MAITDIFKLKEYKAHIEELIQEKEQLVEQNQQLKSLMTDEHGHALDIRQRIIQLEQRETELKADTDNQVSNLEDLQRKTKSLQGRITELNQETEVYSNAVDITTRINDLKKQEDSLKKDVIELGEEKLLQDFGLYKPMYSFATSEEYKEKLCEVRRLQKEMIKGKTAALCATDWLVNNSRTQGKKMTNDNIKQIILTFNIECENVINRVTFSNFESMKARISKAYDKLNHLNESNAITISSQYLDYKYQELALAYEYACKKQEEKDYIREQREIQRENAKVQKELEEEQRRIEKEQSHYENVLHRLLEQIENEQNDARREILQEKVSAAKGELSDLEKALKDVDYRQANERAGYVYIISNIGAFGDDIYKIGMTRRLNPQDRIDELGGASVPFRFDVHAFIFSADAPKLETALHNAFADKRVNMMNNRKEFYHVTLKEIENVVKQNYDKTVDFNYIPDAQQYRESQKVLIIKARARQKATIYQRSIESVF
ncbi:MAG: DUF4041 domain-containing protein [Oscillospiraceae bacterium]|jgi:hypothetical protein|nr:DUF4041 domain-containing protein [Oscillospiraceae bacterium]